MKKRNAITVRSMIPQNPFARAFYTQYTALILIILTFVIGAFVKPARAALDIQDETPAARTPLEAATIGEMKLKNLFLAESSDFDAAELTALETFLVNHDVSIEMEIFSNHDADQSADDRMGLTLARTIAVMRHLRASGIPAEALHVVASPQQSLQQVHIRFVRDQ